MGLFKKLFGQKSKNRKYHIGLEKSQTQTGTQISGLFNYPVQETMVEDLEEALILSDTGINTALSISEALLKKVKKQKPDSSEALKECFYQVMQERYQEPSFELNNGFEVFFIMGVNGVGKTTSIGKLSHQFKNEGYSVLVVAGDTFRAGAMKQLEIWSKNAGVHFYAKEENADPSSVIYEALEYAKKEGIQKVIVDTAGRLHNKKNLMSELDKMVRVARRFDESAPHHRWLVLDATTGQNGVAQAKVFNEIADLNGIILTKLDGTAKGGLIFSIKDQFSVPVRYVGLGEKIDDLALFDLEAFLVGWLGDDF
jgi:fused signal recognition particle receptor